MTLVPRSVESRLGQAMVWETMTGQFPDAERLLRELLVEVPEDDVSAAFGAYGPTARRIEEALRTFDRASAAAHPDRIARMDKAYV